MTDYNTNQHKEEYSLLDLLKSSPLHIFYNKAIEKFVNSIALKEREKYLESNPDDSANGFYSRSLYYSQIPLTINIPRTRSSNFFPGIVPKYKRTIPETYDELVESIILQSRSIEAAKRAIRGLELPVNESTIKEIIEENAKEFREYVNRDLESDWLVVFMDVKIIYVKEDKKVKKMVIYTAVGVNMEGRKEILGSEVYEGNENIEKWKDFLNKLENRGMRRVLLFVTDNFSGLTKLIKGKFKMSMHQLCVVHLVRNARLHLKKEDYKYFREEMKRIEGLGSFEEAYTAFMELVEWLRERGYVHFSRELRGKAEEYVVFTRFPEEIRSRVKSTNASENLHKELKRIRRNSGGYFQSKKILEAKWWMFLRGLGEGVWSKPEPRFKGVLPELHRMFREVYEEE